MPRRDGEVFLFGTAMAETPEIGAEIAKLDAVKPGL
jgi:hypothetical protein